MTQHAADSVLDWGKAVFGGAGERPLTPGERALVPAELAAVIDLSSVKLINRAQNPLALDKILVRGNRIYWPKTPPDISRQPAPRQAILIHELAHVWQYRTGRLTALGYLLQPRNWVYGYTVRDNASLEDYAIEQQADIFEDWFRTRVGLPLANATGRPPRRDWLEQIVLEALNDTSLS